MLTSPNNIRKLCIKQLEFLLECVQKFPQSEIVFNITEIPNETSGFECYVDHDKLKDVQFSMLTLESQGSQGQDIIKLPVDPMFERRDEKEAALKLAEWLGTFGISSGCKVDIPEANIKRQIQVLQS